jgi:L-asparaginase II
VEVVRGDIVESRHRGHVVQVGADGRIERQCGDAEALVTLRSAAKPFMLLALIESGAAEAFALTDPELAVMGGSHSGEDLHVRTIQAIFRRAGLSQSVLACGSEGMPLDKVTAARLARDGEAAGAVRHMCSGQHAASMLLSRHAGWDPVDYWEQEHPSQLAAREAVARVFGVRVRDLRTAVDGCGVLTYAFPLVEVARAYALLADPATVAPDAMRVQMAPALSRIRDAMMSAPEMVGGTRERLDTVLMRVRQGELISKGGNEALRAIGLLAGARGRGTPAAGVAVKVEDGDGKDRASHASTVEALSQLNALDDRALRVLARYHRPPAFDPRGRVVGEAVPDFQLAPISELF